MFIILLSVNLLSNLLRVLNTNEHLVLTIICSGTGTSDVFCRQKLGKILCPGLPLTLRSLGLAIASLRRSASASLLAQLATRSSPCSQHNIKQNKWTLSPFVLFYAREQGLEPQLPGPEPGVLPPACRQAG